METDPERPQTLALPHFPSFFFLAGVKKETHYAERTLRWPVGAFVTLVRFQAQTVTDTVLIQNTVNTS